MKGPNHKSFDLRTTFKYRHCKEDQFLAQQNLSNPVYALLILLTHYQVIYSGITASKSKTHLKSTLFVLLSNIYIWRVATFNFFQRRQASDKHFCGLSKRNVPAVYTCQARSCSTGDAKSSKCQHPKEAQEEVECPTLLLLHNLLLSRRKRN